jgi:Carboxylesterase family
MIRPKLKNTANAFFYISPGSRLRLILILLCLKCPPGICRAQTIQPDIEKQTFIYKQKDSLRLGLDLYRKQGQKTEVKKPCVIFVFGGAFIAGHRDDTIYNGYFDSLATHDYIVVSISYRLGLKGVRRMSKFDIAPLRKAIGMAVEDTYDATNWIISHAEQFGIDTSKIILSGSSSGAITVLEAEYDRINLADISNKLPENFQFAGVVSFAGAILSFNWGLKYQRPPAPTLLFHGTDDKMVPYDKIRFLNKGFYGSSWIAKAYKSKGYPYYIYRAIGLGHEMAVLPMINQVPLILDFLDKWIICRKRYQTDMSFRDPEEKPIMTLTPRELFEKLEVK